MFPIKTRWKLSLGLTTIFLAANLLIKPNPPKLDIPNLEFISQSPHVIKATFSDRNEYYFRFLNVKSPQDTLDVYITKKLLDDCNNLSYIISYSSRFVSFNSKNPRILSNFNPYISSTVDSCSQL